MFVCILLRDSARDFGVKCESPSHREIFEISSRAVKKNIAATQIHFIDLLKLACEADRFRARVPFFGGGAAGTKE